MRSFLGVLMVLAVSANDEDPIVRSAGESVLLPCNCPGRNTDKEFKWQMESDGPEVFVISQTHKDDRYKSRARIFVDDTENLSNCSLLLDDIITNDTGKYKCSFYIGEMYQHVSINLNVTGFSLVGQGKSSQVKPSCCIRIFKIIPIVLLLGFCLVCGAVVRE